MRKAQIAVSVIAVAIVGYLCTLSPVRLRTSEKSDHNNGMVAGDKKQAAAVVSPEMVSAAAKTAIGANLSARINDLEAQLKQATTQSSKLSLQKQLAKAWDDVNQPAPAAFYYQAVAKSDNQLNDWLAAGNRFNDAFRLTQDSSLQATLLNNAVEAFKIATTMQPDNLEAKTGLGVAYVNGGAPSPMEGISLLLDVVGKEPDNWNANFNLGLFSMKSGQFDKAVGRFKTLIAQPKPKGNLVEPWFYMAESYKQLGEKNEALAAYTKCKELMPDPAFVKRIDDYIKELKN